MRYFTRYKKVSLLAAIICLFLVFAFLIGEDRASQNNRQGKLLSVSYDERDVMYWFNLIDEIGSEAAYFELKRMGETVNFSTMHTFAHSYGEALYKHEGKEGVVVCDDSFTSGCYHSFFETAIVEAGPEVLNDLSGVCEGMMCRHGFGHGLLVVYGIEEMSAALAYCEQKLPNELLGCMSGVYMDFEDNDFHFSDQRLNADSIHSPCNMVEERYAAPCYFLKPYLWHLEQGLGFEAIYAECSILSGYLETTCIRGLGKAINSGFDYATSSKVKDTCMALPTDEARLTCIEGVLWDRLGTPWQDNNLVIEYCSLFNGEHQKRCLGVTVATWPAVEESGR